MVNTVLKVLVVIGLVMNIVLVALKVKSNLQTEEGKEKWDDGKKFIPYNTIVGAVANFLDVFGIGSYATSTAAFKFGKSVKDGDIPGTLSAGHTVPICIEAFLFAALAGVDGVTMGALIIAAVLGSFLGAKLVTKLNIQGVRLMMGVGMVILGIIMILRVFAIGPFGLVGNGLKLTGFRLVIAVIVQLILGMLMNIGVGLYAPCMALCAGLGLSVTATLPIVMGSAALLMAFGSGPQYIRACKFDMAATISQMVGGTIGVLIAYFLVKSLDAKIITIVIAVVVLVTAVMFFRDYNNGKPRRRNA